MANKATQKKADQTERKLKERAVLNEYYMTRTSQIFGIVMLTFFPLIVGVGLYTNITEVKHEWFVALTVMYAVSIGIWTLICPMPKSYSKTFLEKISDDAKIARGEKVSWIPPCLRKLTMPQALIVLYVLWGALSAIFSEYSFHDNFFAQSRYEGLFTMILYSAIFFFMSFWGKWTNGIVIGTGFTALIFGALSLPQTFGKSFIYPGDYNFWTTPFLGTIGHIDCVAGLVAILIPVLFAGFIILQNKWRYIALPGLLLISYINLFADADTGKICLLVGLAATAPFMFESREHISRGLIGLGTMAFAFAYYYAFSVEYGGVHTFAGGKKFALCLALGLAAIAIGIVLHFMKFEIRASKRKVHIIVVIILAVIVVCALFYIFNYEGNNGLLSDISSALHGTLPDTAGSIRGYIWKSSWQIMQEKPLFGYGPGCFKSAFDPYNAGYMVYAPNTIVDFAHNDFLTVGVCVGFGGLLIYLAFLVSLFIRAFRVASKKPCMAVLIPACLAYLAYSFFVFSIAIITPMFWTLAGIMDYMEREESKNPLI